MAGQPRRTQPAPAWPTQPAPAWPRPSRGNSALATRLSADRTRHTNPGRRVFRATLRARPSGPIRASLRGGPIRATLRARPSGPIRASLRGGPIRASPSCGVIRAARDACLSRPASTARTLFIPRPAAPTTHRLGQVPVPWLVTLVLSRGSGGAAVQRTTLRAQRPIGGTLPWIRAGAAGRLSFGRPGQFPGWFRLPGLRLLAGPVVWGRFVRPGGLPPRLTRTGWPE